MTAQIHRLHPGLSLTRYEDREETGDKFATILSIVLVVAGFCIFVGTLMFCWSMAKAVGQHDGRLDTVCEARR